MPDDARIVVVMPAYNAAATLAATVRALPHAMLHGIIVVDDASTDNTAAVARELGLQLHVHERNRGYGANQKTCYREALRTGATIVVMVHPDCQHDPRRVADLLQPLLEGRADMVLGSRFLGASPLAQGMPWWKYCGNRLLTGLENAVFGLHLSEFHSGYRAFRADALRVLPWQLNADGFLFDQQIIAQLLVHGLRIAEVPVSTHYPAEASSVGVGQSLRYGAGILWMLLCWLLHRRGLLAPRWLAVSPQR